MKWAAVRWYWYLPFLLSMVHSVAAAQQPNGQTEIRRRWVLTSALTTVRVGSREGWAYGPELSLRRDGQKAWGFGVRVSLPVAGGHQDAGGGAIDLGPTVTAVGRGGEFGLSFGGTAFLLGGSGELTGGGVGGFADLHGTVWLGPRVGFAGGATIRIGSGLSVFPSLSAGLSVRF